MQEALLAAVRPGNTPHGYNLTFAFPMLMFIIVAGALYLRFRGSHNVPGHVAMTSSRWATTGDAGTVNFGEGDPHAAVAPEDSAAAVPAESAEPTVPGQAGEPEQAGEPGQAGPADEGEDGE